MAVLYLILNFLKKLREGKMKKKSTSLCGGGFDYPNINFSKVEKKVEIQLIFIEI